MKEVTLYTDGFCEPNPGRGGWAAILLSGNSRRELSGAALDTTNNRMELTAAIKGLQAISEPCTVALYTDSQYLRQGVTEWLPAWKTRGWRTADRRPVKNQDLWQQLDRLVAIHQISWHWVKGHAGDPLNERCDYLAGRASRLNLNLELTSADADAHTPTLL
jgi:ribonuclease HI